MYVSMHVCMHVI